MKGAIIGDIIGSANEWSRAKTKDFELFPANADFTDNTGRSPEIKAINLKVNKSLL